MNIRHSLVAAVVICTLNVATADNSGTQNTKPLAISDALKMNSFAEVSPFSFSPDGQKIAYAVRDNFRQQRGSNDDYEGYTRTGVYLRNIDTDIWVSATRTGETRNLTGHIGSNWEPSWSPDRHYLAFLSDRGGDGQTRVWVWDTFSDLLRPVANLSVRASPWINPLTWTHDSKSILTTVVPLDMSLRDYTERVLGGHSTLSIATTQYTGPTATLYSALADLHQDNSNWRTAQLSIDYEFLHDLVLVNVETGAVTSLVRKEKVGLYALSPKGDEVVYARVNATSGNASLPLECDLVAVNLHTRADALLVHNVQLNSVSWSPDGSKVAFAAYGVDGLGLDVRIVSLDGSERKLAAGLPHRSYCCQLQVPSWDVTGQNLYYIISGTLWKVSLINNRALEIGRIPNHTIVRRLWKSDGVMWSSQDGHQTVVVAYDNDQKQDVFYKVNLETGQSAEIQIENETVSSKGIDLNHYSSAVSDDGTTIAYLAEDTTHSPDLWLGDTEFHALTPLSHLNPQFDMYQMGNAKIIDWRSGDGEKLHGALLFPSGYRAGKRYPLIVWVYPGTAMSIHCHEFGFGMYPGPLNAQIFATRGYAVFFPDALDEVGNRIGALAKSVLPGVDRVIETGVVDPDRIAIVGHSQGAYAAVSLLTVTQRFRTAIALDGWYDFNALYGVLSKDGVAIQHGQTERQLGATPWDKPLVYVQNSPFFYLDKIETPLLLIHGSNDSLPPFLPEQLFVGLRRSGKQAEYVRYEGEGHVPRDWSLPNQEDLAERILSWIDAQMKDRIR